jgi:hypothetical protein
MKELAQYDLVNVVGPKVTRIIIKRNLRMKLRKRKGEMKTKKNEGICFIFSSYLTRVSPRVMLFYIYIKNLDIQAISIFLLHKKFKV